VLIDGDAYAGTRDPAGNDETEFEWEDLTDNPGYPADACSIAISSQMNTVSVEVLTLDGSVYETICDLDNAGGDPSIVCDAPWERRVSPQDPVNGTAAEQRGTDPNYRAKGMK
jgi:hypothetical protein